MQPGSWTSLRCSPSRTSRALRTPFVCFASFLPPSKNRKFSAQPMTRRRSCQVNFGSFAPASSLWEIIDLSKFWSNFAWLSLFRAMSRRPARDGLHVCKRISSRFRSAIPAQVLTIRLTDLRSTVRALDCLDWNRSEAVGTVLCRGRRGRRRSLHPVDLPDEQKNCESNNHEIQNVVDEYTVIQSRRAGV